MVINLFDNSYTNGACGGNIRCAQIFKQIKQNKPELVLKLTTSRLGHQFYRESELDVKAYYTSNEKVVANFYSTYFYRLCKLIFWSLYGHYKNNLIYCNSDYLIDVIPALLSKIFYKSSWIQVCQLIISHPKKREGSFSNYMAYFCQKISFWFMKMADLVITDGYEIRDILVNKHGFMPEKVKVGFLGVDFDEIKTATPSKDENDLIFVGTLDNRKGIKDFIEVCRALIKDKPDLKALIIAEKTDKSIELQKMIGEYGISKNLHFTGWLKHQSVFSYLKNSKIFLYPSYNESWALVICEAMACGAIALIRNLDVYAKIYEDHAVACRDIKDFIEKAEFYLKDEAPRHELSKKAKAFITRYSWQEVASREWKFIEPILSNLK